MRCQNCGGQLDISDKRCPYCNTINDKYKKPIVRPTLSELNKQRSAEVRKLKIKFFLKLFGACVITAIGIVVMGIIFAKVL